MFGSLRIEAVAPNTGANTSFFVGSNSDAADQLLLSTFAHDNGVGIITGSGLLFDIAGALRLFLLEEIQDALSGFKPNKYGNLPSVAMRELIMPEGSGPYDAYISQFYYKKRGVLLLFIGFALQMVGDLV